MIHSLETELYEKLGNKPTNEVYLKMESDILALFRGILRKDKITPMAFHSIRVGRSLILQKHDIETIFGGYYHDVVEDISPYKEENANAQKDFLFKKALNYMPTQNAKDAALLTFQCIYQEEEYQAQKKLGGIIGKKLRKEMALQRWCNSEIRVKIIKKHDAYDNRADLKGFTNDEKEDYLNWSEKLLKNLN